MDRIEEARLTWQRAQAQLQAALAELEKRVASGEGADSLIDAHNTIKVHRQRADDLLARYITYIGKL